MPKSDYSANQNDFLAQVMPVEINYLTKIRVDIVTTITHLASIAKNPGPVAYKLLAQLHAYLNRTKAFNIVYGTKDPIPVSLAVTVAGSAISITS
jgi:hypothetical protein